LPPSSSCFPKVFPSPDYFSLPRTQPALSRRKVFSPPVLCPLFAQDPRPAWISRISFSLQNSPLFETYFITYSPDTSDIRATLHRYQNPRAVFYNPARPPPQGPSCHTRPVAFSPKASSCTFSSLKRTPVPPPARRSPHPLGVSAEVSQLGFPQTPVLLVPLGRASLVASFEPRSFRQFFPPICPFAESPARARGSVIYLVPTSPTRASSPRRPVFTPGLLNTVPHFHKVRSHLEFLSLQGVIVFLFFGGIFFLLLFYPPSLFFFGILIIVSRSPPERSFSTGFHRFPGGECIAH